MIYAIFVGIVVFLIGNFFLAAGTAGIVGLATSLAVFFGFRQQDTR